MMSIKVKGVVKSFLNNKVLKGINLSVKPGEILVIIGPSGSGKTTLLRSLNLLEIPDSGTVHVGGITIDASRSLSRQKNKILALRKQVGFVFQNFNLFPHRTVIDNIIEGPIVVKKEQYKEAVDYARVLLAKIGLSDKEDIFPKCLSGGQQQRVAIARALAMRPAVILFDEPTSALDPELVREVLGTIRILAKERRTMIIVTHEIDFARNIADRVIFMTEGNILEEGSVHKLFDHPSHERTQLFLKKFLSGA